MKERKTKVFLDTNVWISAYVYSGNEKTIVQKAIHGDFYCIVSEQVIDEFIRVMIDKFNFSKRSVFNAVMEIIQISEVVKFQWIGDLELKDKNDITIVNAAVNAECRYLVTGDKEILGLQSVKKTGMVTPKEFLGLS